MSLLEKSTGCKLLITKEKLKASSDPFWLEALNDESNHVFQSGSSLTWWVCENELSRTFDVSNSVLGKYLIFSMLVTKNVLDGKKMNLRKKHFISEYKNNNNGLLPSKKAISEFKESIAEEKGMTIIKETIVQCALDCSFGKMIASTKSPRMLDMLNILIDKTFDLAFYEDVFLENLDNIDAVTEKAHKEGLDFIDGIQIQPELEKTWDSKIRETFLTWLFSNFMSEGDVSLDCNKISFDDEIFLSGETLGSKDVVIKKGSISECKEILSSLKEGKLIHKAKMIIILDKYEEFNCDIVFDARNIFLNIKKFPTFDGGDYSQKSLERIDFIFDSFGLFEELFSEFRKFFAHDKGWKEEKQIFAENFNINT